MKNKNLTKKQTDKLKKKKRTKKLTKQESKRLDKELNRRYLKCINKLSKQYDGDEKYVMCRYSIYNRKTQKIKYI